MVLIVNLQEKLKVFDGDYCDPCKYPQHGDCDLCQALTAKEILPILMDNLDRLIYAIENHKYYKGFAGDVTDVKLWKVLKEVKDGT